MLACVLYLISASDWFVSVSIAGRMNKTIDHRTDLYSYVSVWLLTIATDCLLNTRVRHRFGVLLYEMLTDRLPFESTVPSELVHAHIARTPVKPLQVGRILGRHCQLTLLVILLLVDLELGRSEGRNGVGRGAVSDRSQADRQEQGRSISDRSRMPA